MTGYQFTIGWLGFLGWILWCEEEEMTQVFGWEFD